MRLRDARGLVDLGSGRSEAALAAFQAAEQCWPGCSSPST